MFYFYLSDHITYQFLCISRDNLFLELLLQKSKALYHPSGFQTGLIAPAISRIFMVASWKGTKAFNSDLPKN